MFDVATSRSLSHSLRRFASGTDRRPAAAARLLTLDRLNRTSAGDGLAVANLRSPQGDYQLGRSVHAQAFWNVAGE